MIREPSVAAAKQRADQGGTLAVGAAAGLLSSGAIGDDYGRRRTFLAGTLLLAGSSVLGALAPNAPVLVLARVLQGLGGAAVLACGLGLIGHAFPAGSARTRATGVWGAALGAGVAVGPILAAGLDAVGGWRLPYVVTALAAVALAVAARALLSESRAARPRPIDAAGTLLIGLGLAALMAGLVEGRTGWNQLPVIALLALGSALVVAFVAVERRLMHPMIDLALFRRPDFVGATVAALAAGAGVLALMSLVPTVLERGLGEGAVLAAAVLLAWSATSVVTALGARWLPARVSPRAQLIAGLVGCAAGQLALVGLTPGSSIGRLLPGLLVAGAANGVLNAAMGRQAVASVPADRGAMGSGANNTARYVGPHTQRCAPPPLEIGGSRYARAPQSRAGRWWPAPVPARQRRPSPSTLSSPGTVRRLSVRPHNLIPHFLEGRFVLLKHLGVHL